MSGGFEGNVSYFTEDFYKLIQPRSPLVSEFAGELNSVAYERTDALLERLVALVSGAFGYDSDENVWGQEDYWATPDELSEVGRGDCDDLGIFASSVLFALGIEHYVVMGYYHGGGGHFWLEVDDGPTVYLLEFSEPTLYVLTRDAEDGKATYDMTPYMPVERIVVN